MKLKNIDNWEYTESLNCFLFFAQSIDEMLFNYTLDTYKAPALNSHTLCDEALVIISEIEKDVINKGSLLPIIAELKLNLDSDIVSKEIFGDLLNSYKEKLNDTSDLKGLSSTIQLIGSVFRNNIYLNQIKELLIEKVKSNKAKEDILILTRSFVTELINLGYNSNFIFTKVNQFFFGTKKINKIDQISNFFEIFDFSKSKYQITFFAPKLFREIKDSSEKMGLKVSEDFDTDDLHPSNKGYVDKLKNEKIFVTSEEESVDYYSAYKNAEKKVEKVACLFNFFHHKSKLRWMSKILIRNSENGDNFLITVPEPSILNCKDLRPKQASKDLKKTIKNFSLSPNSFRRLDKSLDLHSYALNSASLENQLINIWTAFETLIPKKVNIQKDRIIQLSDIVIPFQSIDYIKKLIEHLQKSLIDWNFNKYKYICKSIVEGDNNLEKIGAFVSLAKYEALRKEVYEKLAEENYLLLLNRIFFLNKNLSETDAIKDLISKHAKRIEWHFQRIYRTRNLIIHSGRLFAFTTILIENLHSYFDIMIKQVFKLTIDEKRINTLEQSFSETQVRYNYHLNFLDQNKGKQLTDENYKRAIFGLN